MKWHQIKRIQFAFKNSFSIWKINFYFCFFFLRPSFKVIVFLPGWNQNFFFGILFCLFFIWFFSIYIFTKFERILEDIEGKRLNNYYYWKLEIEKFGSEIFFRNLASSSKVREIFGRCDIRGMSRDIIYRDDSDEFDDCYLEMACRLVYGFEDKILYCENNVWKEKRF